MDFLPLFLKRAIFLPEISSRKRERRSGAASRDLVIITLAEVRKSCGLRGRSATLATIAVDWPAISVAFRFAGDIFPMEPILQ
jgi:hypothetical protein